MVGEGRHVRGGNAGGVDEYDFACDWLVSGSRRDHPLGDDDLVAFGDNPDVIHLRPDRIASAD